MFILYGKRRIRIKKYREHDQDCKKCGVFDIDAKVYREYFHIFFIPLCPVGEKEATISCRQCGFTMWIDALQKQYEKKSITPFYFYSWPIIFAALIAIIVKINIDDQYKKEKFVLNPKVGDIYTICDNENNTKKYYFLRLSAINGNTVTALHNNFEYSRFISSLDKSDYFVKDDELIFLKSDLKKLLEENIISSVEREYTEDFNRIR